MRLVQGKTDMKKDWTWEDIQAYDDFMESWANAYLCETESEDGAAE